MLPRKSTGDVRSPRQRAQRQIVSQDSTCSRHHLPMPPRESPSAFFLAVLCEELVVFPKPANAVHLFIGTAALESASSVWTGNAAASRSFNFFVGATVDDAILSWVEAAERCGNRGLANRAPPP